MSADTFTIESEAPPAQAEEIRLLLEALELPEGRLTQESLERVVAAVEARPDLYDGLVEHDNECRWWLLYRSPSLEVKLETWERDVVSSWHDHAGSSGAFAVSSGALSERSRRTDLVSIESRALAAGERRTFGPEHIHEVVATEGVTRSVHAYSPPLAGLTYYDQTKFGFVTREFIAEADRPR